MVLNVRTPVSLSPRLKEAFATELANYQKSMFYRCIDTIAKVEIDRKHFVGFGVKAGRKEKCPFFVYIESGSDGFAKRGDSFFGGLLCEIGA